MAKQTFTTGQVLTAGQMTSLQQTAMGGGAATAKTTSYTLVAADAGTVVAMNSGSATTITVNTGLFAAGDTVQIQNLGAGVTTVTAGTATVSTSAVLALKQYDAGTLYFVSTGVAVFFSSDAADSPLTTKGDLYTYSTTNDRLPVGANGETLVADNSTATGLRYQGLMASGKNIFLNSDFSVWQRGTSFTNPANLVFIADRWYMYYDGSGATRTISQQTFTGDNPSGCNASYYLRFAQSVAGTGGSVANAIFNKIEDVRKFNGQTVTVSFWAKADASRTISLSTYQEFGTGGSSAVFVNTMTAAATTSWTRFSATFALPSVSGKTITSNSSISHIMGFPMNAVGTFDVTGFQIELGSVATAFQTATGTIQGELAACQRYYYRQANTGYQTVGTVVASTSTVGNGYIPIPISLRTSASSTLDYSGVNFYDAGANSLTAATALTMTSSGGINGIGVSVTVASGLTQFRSGSINTVSGYVGISAEL